jgi:cytoskeletal protein RodZ
MTEQKHHTLSRRSLLGDQLGLILALVIVPSLTAACGTAETAQQSGGATTPAKRAARSSGDSRSSSRSSKSNDTDDSASFNSKDLSDSDAELGDVKPFDSSGTADAQVAQNGKSPSQASSNQQSAGQRADSRVTGAKPDGGFFSRGAPQLSLAQIESGQQIRAKCEGSFHELVIEPEHLQALAQGQSVTIKSSTNTHFANPTVHNHSVTYSPLMG